MALHVRARVDGDRAALGEHVLHARGEVLGARVVHRDDPDLQGDERHPRLLRLGAGLLLGRDRVELRDADDAAHLLLAEPLRAQHEVEGLVPGDVAQRDRHLPGDVVGDDDVLLRDVGDEPQEVADLDVVEVEGDAAAAVAGLRRARERVPGRLRGEPGGLRVGDPDDRRLPGLRGSIGQELLKVHLSYGPLVQKLLLKFNPGKASAFAVKGLAHITGGGFPDNIPRVLPKGLGARINLGAVPVLPVFKWLADAGGIAQHEMLRTFNCGIGMLVIVSEKDSDAVMRAFTSSRENVVVLGTVIKASGHERVIYDGKLNLG